MTKRTVTHGLGKFIPPFPQYVSCPQFRDGMGFREGDLRNWIEAGGWVDGIFSKTINGEGTFMSVEQAATSAAESVANVANGYLEKVKALKSNLQNDSASIKASAERIEKEIARVAASVSNVSSVLTSPQFAEALANAERLAAALSAIQSLGSGSIAFHVQSASDTGEHPGE